MPSSCVSQGQNFVPKTSIRWKVLQQSVLLVTFCVLLLGGLSFFIIRSFQEGFAPDAEGTVLVLRLLGVTVLMLSGLLFLLALLLGTLLARSLTEPLQELTAKVGALTPGTWRFERTVHTGDEVEALDRVIDDLTGRLRDAYKHLEEKVTERTRQLREESALDRAILESIEYGVLAMDVKGTVKDANPAACFLLQCDRGDLLGQSCADALPLSQRRGQIAGGQHPVTTVLRTRKSWHAHPSHHLTLQQKDGTALPISLLIVPLCSSDRCFGAIAVIQDQTLERQIDYMKSEFISLASHQLRTPLSSIRWYVEMLRNEEGTFSQEHQSYLQEADIATTRMANLIDALLHVAKLEDGGLVADKKNSDLRPFFRRVIDGWTVTAKGKGIVLTADIPASLPDIVTDPVLLEIVLQNLFANAIKYSSTKKPVTLRIVPEKDCLKIIVQDQGLGIPQAEQKRIFQKFFRAKNVREIDTDGTGLGLSMSRTIVENLGGTLTFKSEEGKGSEFTVALPV